MFEKKYFVDILGEEELDISLHIKFYGSTYDTEDGLWVVIIAHMVSRVFRLSYNSCRRLRRSAVMQSLADNHTKIDGLST